MRANTTTLGRLAGLVLGIAAGLAPGTATAERLPVYRLATPKVDADRAEALLASVGRRVRVGRPDRAQQPHAHVEPDLTAAAT